MLITYEGRSPTIDPTAFVVPSATVVGAVTIGPESSIWFGAVVRGDIEPIRIGSRTNVQDNATLHVVGGRFMTTLGDGVTIGHNAVVHGCTIGDGALVGMGAIVLDGVVVEAECLIGAGAVVPPGAHVATRSLVLGNPGRTVRRLTDEEVGRMRDAATNYVGYAARYRQADLG